MGVTYGTTPQGNITINSVATPTADATWSVGNGGGWLNLAGKFFTNQPYTATLTGPGMTYVTSMNNASAFGGSGNLLRLVVEDAAVSFANDGYYSQDPSSLSIPGGSLTLVSSNSSYGGTTAVSAGTLLINGNNSAVTTAISLVAGTTIGGSGTHGGLITIAANTTLSPGNSPGTFTSAAAAWEADGDYNWQLVDAAGTAGSDWDLLNVTGVLDITATSGTPFNVNLWTLASTGPDVDGNATNFSSNSQYSWKMASAAGGVTGFAANKFQVNTASTNGTAGFANSFGSGQFSVANAGRDRSSHQTHGLRI